MENFPRKKNGVTSLQTYIRVKDSAILETAFTFIIMKHFQCIVIIKTNLTMTWQSIIAGACTSLKLDYRSVFDLKL